MGRDVSATYLRFKRALTGREALAALPADERQVDTGKLVRGYCGNPLCSGACAPTGARSHTGPYRILAELESLQPGSRCLVCQRRPCACLVRCRICGGNAVDKAHDEPDHCAACGGRMVTVAPDDEYAGRSEPAPVEYLSI